MNKINCPIFKFHGEVVKENKKITQTLLQSEATYEVNLKKRLLCIHLRGVKYIELYVTMYITV